MFGPSDKPTIKDLWKAVGRELFRLHGYTDDTPKSVIDYQSLSDATSEHCWEFLQNSARASVLLASGKSMAVRPELFEYMSEYNPVGYHVDLNIGTVGSGDFGRFGANTEPTAYYGPAQYCTILLDRREIDKFIKKSFGTAVERAAKPHVTAETVLKYKREHPDARKADIKSALASSMSVRAFGDLWRKAAKIDPKLTAPGRPRNPNTKS